MMVLTCCLAAPRPTVLWHGMGDTCCFSFSMGAVKDSIEQSIPGVYVSSIMIGSNIVEDEAYGFLGDVSSEVSDVCSQLKSDPQLQNGFNAVGFSQGGQFLRAYVERCNDPPVYNLITMGGQHQGVADIPECTSVNSTICSLVEELLALGAYNSLVQELVIQAQYFHDPLEPNEYLTYNTFLPDINSDITINTTYKENIMKLNNLVLVMFAEDTVVVPKESSWFGFFPDNDLSKIIPYNQTQLYIEDRIGLKSLDEAGKLKFDSCPGNHMKFTMDWFNQHVTVPFLTNEISK
jgi:palmitoyl-protein thioesterase